MKVLETVSMILQRITRRYNAPFTGLADIRPFVNYECGACGMVSTLVKSKVEGDTVDLVGGKRMENIEANSLSVVYW